MEDNKVKFSWFSYIRDNILNELEIGKEYNLEQLFNKIKSQKEFINKPISFTYFNALICKYKTAGFISRNKIECSKYKNGKTIKKNSGNIIFLKKIPNHITTGDLEILCHRVKYNY